MNLQLQMYLLSGLLVLLPCAWTILITDMKMGFRYMYGIPLRGHLSLLALVNSLQEVKPGLLAAYAV